LAGKFVGAVLATAELLEELVAGLPPQAPKIVTTEKTKPEKAIVFKVIPPSFYRCRESSLGTLAMATKKRPMRSLVASVVPLTTHFGSSNRPSQNAKA
jgi:hypothetical protein